MASTICRDAIRSFILQIIEQCFTRSLPYPGYGPSCAPVPLLETHEAVLRMSSHDTRYRPRPRIRQVLVLLACVMSSAYFGYHALHGRHGLNARNQLNERASLLDFEIKSLDAVRSKLERDVALLAPDKPDPDMVEEIARDVLGYVHPRDILVAGRMDAP